MLCELLLPVRCGGVDDCAQGGAYKEVLFIGRCCEEHKCRHTG